MIVLPAIPALVAALTPIAKAMLISAGIGAAVGGATCAVGGAVSGYREHGELNRDVAINTAHQAAEFAGEGALFGAVIGPAAPMIAPAIAPATQFVDDLAAPVVGIIDDVANSAVGSIGYTSAIAGSTAIVDDTTSPLLSRARQKIGAAAGGIGSGIRLVRNKLIARFFTRLSTGSGNNGYVYVMDDVSTPGRFKIGKTTRPAERLGEVQSKTGLKLDYTCIIGTDDMNSLERTLHKEFDRQRRRDIVPGTTEIFLLNSAQLASACSR